jgi:hypothetical protein
MNNANILEVGYGDDLCAGSRKNCRSALIQMDIIGNS